MCEERTEGETKGPPAEQEAGGGKKKAAAPAERRPQPRRELGPQQPRGPSGRQEGGLGPAGMWLRGSLAPLRPPRDPGLGPPGEAPPPAVASDSPEDARSPVAGRGGFRGAYATPGLLGRARGREPGFEAQLCSVAPGPVSGLGGPEFPPPGPPAHSRVSLLPIPLHERPAGRGVSATGGGAGYNQSQAGNSSRGALAGLREWGWGAAGAEAGNLPVPPRPLLLRPQHHGNWAACRPPGSAPHSCLWGGAGHESRAAPCGPVRAGRRGFPNPPPDLRRASSPHSR